jgi:hypothetical protein
MNEILALLVGVFTAQEVGVAGLPVSFELGLGEQVFEGRCTAMVQVGRSKSQAVQRRDVVATFTLTAGVGCAPFDGIRKSSVISETKRSDVPNYAQLFESPSWQTTWAITHVKRSNTAAI